MNLYKYLNNPTYSMIKHNFKYKVQYFQHFKTVPENYHHKTESTRTKFHGIK